MGLIPPLREQKRKRFYGEVVCFYQKKITTAHFLLSAMGSVMIIYREVKRINISISIQIGTIAQTIFIYSCKLAGIILIIRREIKRINKSVLINITGIYCPNSIRNLSHIVSECLT